MHKKVKSTGQGTGTKDMRISYNSGTNNKASTKYMNQVQHDSYNIGLNQMLDENHGFKSVSLNRGE